MTLMVFNSSFRSNEYPARMINPASVNACNATALFVPYFPTKNLKRKFVSYIIKFLHDVVIFTSKINENNHNAKNENETHHGIGRPANKIITGKRVQAVPSFFLVPA